MNWIKLTKDTFLIVISAIFLLLTLNILSILAYDFYISLKISDRYSALSLEAKKNYSHISAENVNSLLDATWKPGWVYEEVVGFREKQRQSEYVNVNSFGFRSKIDNVEFRNELTDSVWFFGGSTTFGYGVSDSETIPFVLSSYLGKSVVNLGRGYYFSLQENLLLNSLLKSGIRPSKVIFLDGFNERCSIATYQQQMKLLFSQAQYPSKLSLANYILNFMNPIITLLVKVANKFGSKPIEQNQSSDLRPVTCDVVGESTLLAQVLNEYLKQRKVTCDAYSLDCTTFVQPFAGVHGKHLVYSDLDQSSRDKLGDKFRQIRDKFLENGALDISDALNQLQKHAFIDGVHYSHEANRIIAERIYLSLEMQN